jgi:hypothetical protein
MRTLEISYGRDWPVVGMRKNGPCPLDCISLFWPVLPLENKSPNVRYCIQIEGITPETKPKTKDKIMTASNNEIWNAAELLTEWDANGLRYKLLEVPRMAIDEDEDEANAHLLIGIDSGNVRRVDVLLDVAYGREISDIETVRTAAESAPEDAADILNEYLA